MKIDESAGQNQVELKKSGRVNDAQNILIQI